MSALPLADRLHQVACVQTPELSVHHATHQCPPAGGHRGGRAWFLGERVITSVHVCATATFASAGTRVHDSEDNRQTNRGRTGSSEYPYIHRGAPRYVHAGHTHALAARARLSGRDVPQPCAPTCTPSRQHMMRGAHARDACCALYTMTRVCVVRAREKATWDTSNCHPATPAKMPWHISRDPAGASYTFQTAADLHKRYGAERRPACRRAARSRDAGFVANATKAGWNPRAAAQVQSSRHAVHGDRAAQQVRAFPN